MVLDVLQHVLLGERLALLLLQVREIRARLDPLANRGDLVFGQEAGLLGHVLEHTDAAPEIGLLQSRRGRRSWLVISVSRTRTSKPSTCLSMPWQR